MPFEAMPRDEFDYLLTLSAEERATYLRGKKDAPAARFTPGARGNPNAPQAPQRAISRPFSQQAAQVDPGAQGAFMDDFGPVAQGTHLQGMISGVQKAYRDENRSRVQQAAAQQEQEFELEKERLRQESLLRRLAIEQEEREKDRILQKQLSTGVTTRKFVNGGWEDV